MDLIILLQAKVDIQKAFNRYEDIQEGRGELFSSELDRVLTLLRLNPGMGSVYINPVRRVLLRSFPYGVFYVVEGGRIILTTVTDTRQDPEKIKYLLFE